MVALEYSEFPKINTPHAFVTALQDSMTLALLGIMSGTATVGYYGMMMRLLKLPAALIGQAVAQVAYRELAEARNQGQPLRPILKRMNGNLPVIKRVASTLKAFVLGEASCAKKIFCAPVTTVPSIVMVPPRPVCQNGR